MVIDSKGKFLRSWGKGTMSIPHSIRLDPADNVWIGDAHTSMFYKFTPEGKKLMEISVGDIPDPNRPWYVRMTLDSGCGHCGSELALRATCRLIARALRHPNGSHAPMSCLVSTSAQPTPMSRHAGCSAHTSSGRSTTVPVAAVHCPRRSPISRAGLIP